jgi:hypothetical protein
MEKKPGREPKNAPTEYTAGSTQPSDAESAEELRALAVALEIAATEGLAGVAELQFPLTTGNLQEFPRPAPEGRAAAQGVEYLRDSAQRASAILAALAAAREQGPEIPPVLRATVEPFISALRAQK